MPLNKEIETTSALGLVKSIPNIRQEWRIKTPYQKWCYLYSLGRLGFKVIHYPLYETNQELSALSHLTIVIIGTIVLLEIYTLYFYIVRGDIFGALPSTCSISGPVLGVSSQNTNFYLR